MAERTSSKAERGRWRDIVIGHLKDFPRQYAALENAMNAFGDDFELQAFKAAFDTTDDMETYNASRRLSEQSGACRTMLATLPRPASSWPS